MAGNDGTLNQRETGVGIFDQMTFQNEAEFPSLNPFANSSGGDEKVEPIAEKEDVSRHAHELAYGDNNNQSEQADSGRASYERNTEQEKLHDYIDADYEMIEPEQVEEQYQGIYGYGAAENQEAMDKAVEQEQAARLENQVQIEAEQQQVQAEQEAQLEAGGD